MGKFNSIPPEIARKLNESLGRVRRILAFRGICATLAVLVASVLAIMAIDAMVTIYTSWVRWLLWGVGLVATSAVCWGALIRPLRRKFTAAEIALLIERNHPELEERLSTVVELAQLGDFSASDSLMAEITKEAVKDVGTVSPKKEFTGRTVKPRLVAAAVAVGVLALLFALFPKATLRLAMRALVPSAEVDNVYASSLKVTPGDQTLLEGSSLTVNLAVEAGFPSRAFVRTRPDGKGEAVERMDRTGEEGAKGHAFYRFSYPRVTRSFTYRMNCGSALTRAYRVEVVPEPTYADRLIEIVHPGYTGRKPEHYTNTANVVGLAGSKVRVSAKPARAGVTGEARLPGGVTVPAAEADDGRLEFRFELLKDVEGRWCTVAWDGNGFTNEVDVGGISVVKDTPPEVMLTYPEESEVKLPKVGSLPMQFTVKDDFGVSRAVLEMCLGAGAWEESEEVPVAKSGDFTWEGDKTVHLMSKALGNAGIVRFRIKVEDNLPSGLGGPGVAYSSEVLVNMVQKRDAERGGKSLGEQSLKREIADAKKDVQDISQRLRKARQCLAGAADGYRRSDNAWHRDQAKRNSGWARDEMVNAEAMMSDFIDGLRAGRLDTGVEIFTPVQKEHIVPIRQGAEDVLLLSRDEEKSQSSARLAKDVDAALKALEQARKRFDVLSQKAEELQRLEDLAAREKALAEMAERGEISAEELAQQERELAEELKREIRDDLERNLDRQKAEAEKLAKRGDELKARQEEVARQAEAAKSGTEADRNQVAAEEEKLAREIVDFANRARALTESIEKEAGSPEMDRNRTSEPSDNARELAERATDQANEAAANMKKGDVDAAKRNMDGVKDALSQAQDQLNAAQGRMDAKNREFADSARQHQETAEALQDAADAAQAAADEQRATERQGDSQERPQPGEQWQGQPQQGQKQPGEQQSGEPQQQGEPQQGPSQQKARQKAQDAANKMRQQARRQAQQNNFDEDQFQSDDSGSDDAETDSPESPNAKPGKPSKRPKRSKAERGRAFAPAEDPSAELDWFKMKSDSSADAEADGMDDVPAEYRGLVREYFNALNRGGK